jgi:hypothetical protein
VVVASGDMRRGVNHPCIGGNEGKTMSQDDEETLRKLRELLAGDTTALTAAELRRLRAMLAAFDTFLAGGKLGKWFLGTIILLSAGIAAAIKLAEYAVAMGRTSP